MEEQTKQRPGPQVAGEFAQDVEELRCKAKKAREKEDWKTAEQLYGEILVPFSGAKPRLTPKDA